MSAIMFWKLAVPRVLNTMTPGAQPSKQTVSFAGSYSTCNGQSVSWIVLCVDSAVAAGYLSAYWRCLVCS